MLTDLELLNLYPNHSLADLRYFQAIGQLWACKGSRQSEQVPLMPMVEQWRDYNRQYWPGFIGHI